MASISRSGVNRPGRLERSAEGLKAKVLAEVGIVHRLGAGSSGAGANAPTLAGGAERGGGERGSPTAGG
jgi:hypothetical protein